MDMMERTALRVRAERSGSESESGFRDCNAVKRRWLSWPASQPLETVQVRDMPVRVVPSHLISPPKTDGCGQVRRATRSLGWRRGAAASRGVV